MPTLTSALTFTAIFASLAFAIFPLSSLAQGFPATEFLRRSAAAQEDKIYAMVLMTKLMTRRTRPSTSRCINSTYFENLFARKQLNALIIKAIRDNPATHPNKTVMGVLRKRCGPLRLGPAK